MPVRRLDKVLAGPLRRRSVWSHSVTFVDIAGLVRGASEGEGLGNKFLAAIRETDAVCQVVRAFDNVDVIHVDGKIDQARDIETVNTELILADLADGRQPARPSKLAQARMKAALKPRSWPPSPRPGRCWTRAG